MTVLSVSSSRLFLLIILALSLFVLGGRPSPVHATVYIVTKTADTADGSCDASDCSLREAIIEGNATGGVHIIGLPAGTYTLTRAGEDDAAFVGDLDITRSFSILGDGAANTIIDGNGSVIGDRVFHLDPSRAGGITVEMSGVTIRKGSKSAGGGIWNNGSLTLTDSVVTANTATSDGGGIMNLRGTLELWGTTVSGNAASGDGGGIWSEGSLLVADGSISGNTATARGGGIYNHTSSTLVMASTAVSGNPAGGDGGGIYNGGTLLMTHTTVSGNTAGGDGGGIYNGDALTVVDSTVSDNSTALSGGGIKNGWPCTANVSNSTITGNSALSGGGVDNRSALLLGNTTITANSASAGGGIWATDVALTNTIVANNGSGPDCFITTGTTSSYSLDSDNSCGLTGVGDLPNTDPKLGPLAYNGGPTKTHALLGDSPALDSGGGCPPPVTDQRGISRPRGAACDIGAFEYQAPLDPGSVSWGDGRIDVFARGSDFALWHRYYARGQGWSGWESLGGTLYSGPAVSSWAEGRLDVFALATDYKLRHKWYVRGQGWSKGLWENLGAPPGLTLALHPRAVSWDDGRIDIFALGSDGALWHKYYARGQGWSGWESLGGDASSGTAVSSWTEGRLDVFAIDSDYKLKHRWYVRGEGWSGWEDLGAPPGLIITLPAAESWADGRIDVFAGGNDGAVWHKYYARGQGWSGWESLGGDAHWGTAVSSWAEGRLDVFTADYTEYKLRHKWYIRGDGWSGWEDLGKP